MPACPTLSRKHSTNQPGTRAEPAGPGEQVLIAGGRGGDAAGADLAAELVVGMGDVQVQVGVDPHGDPRRRRLCPGGDGRLPFCGGMDGTHRPGGRTRLRWVCGDRLL
ncbi:MAG: hypothetical protein ACJ8CN_12510 [Gemmatimonadales bacterium]